MSPYYKNTSSIIGNFKLIPWLIIIVFCIVLLSSNYSWIVSDTTIKLERIAALPILFLAIVFFSLDKKHAIPRASFTLLISWLMLSFLSSVLSEVASWSIKMWLLLLIAASYYFSCILLRFHPVNIFNSRTFIFLGWIFGPFSVVIYVLSIVNFPLPIFFESWIQSGSGGLRIRATFLEANIFGGFLTLMILQMIALNRKHSFQWWFIIIGLHFSLLLTFSRVPWLAYVVGLLNYVIILSPKPYNINRITKASIYLLLFICTAFLTVYFIYIAYGDYELIGRIHSISSRLIMWKLAWFDVIQHPFLGNGVFSLSELHIEASSFVGSNTRESVWISNLYLSVLHDTGAIGLLLFLMFITNIILRGTKSVRQSAIEKDVDRRLIRVNAALVSTGISFLISGQSTPTHALGFYWAIFALIERGILEMHQQRRTTK